jgi:ribosome-associated protein
MPPPLRPPPYALDPRSLERDCRLEIFTGGGPGGQHRNKTQNAVRIHHPPSGLVVTATERRSLEANRRAAMERLIGRLERLNEVKRPRKATRPTRGSVERRLSAKAHAARRKTERHPRDD